MACRQPGPFPDDWLTVPNIAVVISVRLLTFVLPAVVSTAICYSVASTDDGRA
jgi:hypothetical protein